MMARAAGRGSRRFLEGMALLVWVLAADLLGLAAATLLLRVTPPAALALHLAFLSLVTFLLFALDKSRASRERRRISEFNLLVLSALGGAGGGLVAMGIFRHKTRQLHFRLLLPVFLFVHAVVMAILVLA